MTIHRPITMLLLLVLACGDGTPDTSVLILEKNSANDREIVVDLTTGEVTATGYDSMAEAARDFRRILEKVYPQVFPACAREGGLK